MHHQTVMVIIRSVLAVGLVLLGAACASRSPRPQPPPPVATFAVVAVDETGTVIEGAVVDTSIIPGVPDGTTNSDGYIKFDGVPVGVSFEAQATKDGHDAWWASVNLTGNLQVQAVMPRHGPSPPPPHGGPLVGRLRLEGDCFRDDTGCLLPIYEHYGDAFSVWVREPSRVLPQLDDIVAAGYHGVRVWATLGCGPRTGDCHPPDYWFGREVGPDVTPGYWQHVEAFRDALRARGLRAIWSQGDTTQIRDHRAYMQALVARERDGGAPWLDWVDAANEGHQTGLNDPAALARIIQHYKDAGGQALVTTTDAPIYHTSTPAHELIDRYAIPPSDVFDIHSYRGDHARDKRRHPWGYTYCGEPCPRMRFGINSEPPGNGDRVSATANKHELDDEAVALIGLGSALGRLAFVHFSGRGVISDGWLREEAGFWSTARALRLLPADVMTYPESHHSGDRFASIRVLEPQGDVRIDGRRHPDGRFAYTIDGPGGHYRLRVTRSFEARLCHPGTGACEDVSRNAGETLDVGFVRGRLLVGRVR